MRLAARMRLRAPARYLPVAGSACQLELLANQLDVLVVDPRFYKFDGTWLVAVVGAARVLGAAARTMVRL